VGLLRSRVLVRWLWAVGLLAALFLCRRPLLSGLGEYLVDSESPQQADLILVLGGNFWGDRVIEGAELSREKYAPVVLLSSPPYAGRPQGYLSVPFLVQRGFPSDNLEVFAHHARSTIEEANVLRPELARRGARRVLLVTSNYHSRRAAIVFRLFCPEVEFIPVPANDREYNAESWWKDASSRHLFFSEWVKICGTLLVAYPRYLVKRWFGI